MTPIECADPPILPGALKCDIPAARIFEMLDHSYRLSHFDLLPKTPSFDAVPGFFENAVSILAALAENRIRRGLYRRHVERPEDLRFIPSPADNAGWLQKAFGEDPYLRCRYDGSVSDFEDNEILLWTLYTASKAQLSQNGLAQQLRQSYRSLAGSMALTDENANVGITRFYHRLQDSELPIHGLCRLILEHLGPEIRSNAEQPIPLAVNMAALFQAFIAEWLKTRFAPAFNVRVHPTIQFGASSGRTVGLDITLEARKSCQPLVTIRTVETFPEDTEIQRLIDSVTMMRSSDGTGLPTAVLVHPSVPARENRTICTQINGVVVRVVGIDLNNTLSAAGADLLEQIGLTA